MDQRNNMSIIDYFRDKLGLSSILNHYPRGKYQMNKIIKREDLANMSRSEMILFIYISIEYNSKRKIKNTEENMLIQLSYPEFKDIIGNKNSFYEAIRFYEERGLLKKKDQSRNLFYLNPMILSNLTGHQQEELGLMNEKSNKTTE